MSNNIPKKLYLIGNGFDLHHDVQSSYRYFADWLKRHDRDIYETYRRVCLYEGLWQDFERGMAFVSRSYFLDLAMNFLPSLKGREADDLTLAEIYLAGDWGTEFAMNLVKNLKLRFTQWISSIKTPGNYNEKMVSLDMDASFLSFNYTDFLESRYQIPADRIKYIHGKSRGRNSNLIVGHGEDGDGIFDKWYEKIRRGRPITKKGKRIYVPTPYLKFYKEPTCYIPEYEHLTECIEVYYEESQKPVKQIIEREKAFFQSLSNIETVTSLGFSFSNVDLPYIQAIISNNSCPQRIKWNVSIKSDADEQRAISALLGMGIDRSAINPFDMSIMPKHQLA